MPIELYRLDLRGKYAGQLCVNTFYWTLFKHNDVADVFNDLFNLYDGAFGWKSLWLQMPTNGYVCDSVKVNRVSPNRGLREGRSFTPSTGTGIASGNAVPPWQAMPIIRRARNASRAFNGRLMVPGVPLATWTAGVLNPLSEAAVAGQLLAEYLKARHTGITPVGQIPNVYYSVLVRTRPPFLTPDDFQHRAVGQAFVAQTPGAVRSRRVDYPP